MTSASGSSAGAGVAGAAGAVCTGPVRSSVDSTEVVPPLVVLVARAASAIDKATKMIASQRVERVRDLITRKGFDVMVEQDPIYEGTCIYNLYAVRTDPAAASDTGRELSFAGGDQ